jgi:hypothetical protein
MVMLAFMVAAIASPTSSWADDAPPPSRLDPADLVRRAAVAEPPVEPRPATLEERIARYPVRLREPLRHGDDLVEVTEARTLRRRYRHWGDWDREVADFKESGGRAVALSGRQPRTIRVACVFFEDARLVCPQIAGGDGRPLEAAYTTPEWFRRRMREQICGQYGDFTTAFSGGEIRLEWIFVTVRGLTWTFSGSADPTLSFQPRAIAEQFEKAVADHAAAGIEMWVLCGGIPTPLNPRDPRQRVAGPPYGVSYTQWKLHEGYSLVVTAPNLPLLVHEFNHRYLDNLESIEGVQLTLFHGLAMLGYEAGDCGYDDLLNTYRSVYQHLIRPAMHRRFSLAAEHRTPREPFSGRAYAWSDVADDLWFRVPELDAARLAQITGLPSLEIVGDRRDRHRLFRVSAADGARLRSPLAAAPADDDTRLDNLLSLATESCAVLATDTGHWLVVRPDMADVYVDMGRLAGRDTGPLEVHGWINQGVRPLVVLRADPGLAVPDRELGYFRGP